MVWISELTIRSAYEKYISKQFIQILYPNIFKATSKVHRKNELMSRHKSLSHTYCSKVKQAINYDYRQLGTRVGGWNSYSI